MYDNQNYPWAYQKAPNLVKIYDGLFPLVSKATPLGIGNAFYLDYLTGKGLLQYGQYWGLRGVWSNLINGMTWDMDIWNSPTKVWDGTPTDINEDMFKKYISVKTFANGKNMSLNLLKDCFDILLVGKTYTIEVIEDYLEYIIKITASQAVIDTIFQIKSSDPEFLGKPSGIKYSFLLEAI